MEASNMQRPAGQPSTAGDFGLAEAMQREEIQRAHEHQGTSVPVQVVGAPTASPMVQGTLVTGHLVGGPVGPHAIAAGPRGEAVLVTVGSDLTVQETIVLNYRFSLTCFSVIDAVSTSLNVAQGIARWSSDEDDDNPGTLRDGVAAWVGLFGLIFLAGPICGFIGARRLNRPLTMVYLLFCTVKMFFEISLAALTLSFWFIIIALIQIWVTKIVFTFWRALGLVPKERCRELLQPGIATRGRMVYW